MDPKKPVQEAKEAVETVAEKAAEMLEKPIPGVPAAGPRRSRSRRRRPSRCRRSPTRPPRRCGRPPVQETGATPTARAQQGAYLTTSQGARLPTPTTR